MAKVEFSTQRPNLSGHIPGSAVQRVEGLWGGSDHRVTAAQTHKEAKKRRR